MKVTERTIRVLAARRQRRALLAKGYEYVGENGGMLWEIYRGGRCGMKIVDAIVDVSGMGVYVKIEAA